MPRRQRVWAATTATADPQAPPSTGERLWRLAVAAALRQMAREPGKWAHLHLCFGLEAPELPGEAPADSLALVLNGQSHILHVVELRAASALAWDGRRLRLDGGGGTWRSLRPLTRGATAAVARRVEGVLPAALRVLGPVSCRRVLWLPEATTADVPPEALVALGDGLLLGDTARPLNRFAGAAPGATVAPLGYCVETIFEGCEPLAPRPPCWLRGGDAVARLVGLAPADDQPPAIPQDVGTASGC